MARLLHSGQVIVDLAMALDTLPRSGGDVLAHDACFYAGGGFNVMAAAQRNGLQSVYLGRHGQGRFGDLAREALHAEGIQLSLAIDKGKDTGVCVALTEASAERTFISCIGAEGGLSAEDLAHVSVQPDDHVYVSGYSLLHAHKAEPLLRWILSLASGVHVAFDPGPLLADIAPQLLNALLPRLNLWTSNSAEARSFTASPTLLDALPALAARLPEGCVSVVRDGPQGCWVSDRHGQQPVAGFKVQAVDSNGAGDAHTGVMIAALAAGYSPIHAATRANAAAALAVTRRGPATAPGTAEVDALLGKYAGNEA